jgi:hypothetical protein
MPIIDSALKKIAQVQPGGNVLRVGELVSGTLYAVYFKPLAGAREGSIVVAANYGIGGNQVPYAALPAAVQTVVNAFRADTGAAAYPAGFVVAGASANYARTAPQFSLDVDASTDVIRMLRVAVPDFNSPTATGLSYIEVRCSRDGGNTFADVHRLNAPFPGGLNYGVVPITVPYEQDVQVVAQGYFKDGNPGRSSRPLVLKGFAKPDRNTLAAPTLVSAVGTLVYTQATNNVSLSLVVEGTPDPLADQLQVKIVNPGDNSVKAASLVNVDTTNPAAVLKATFDNLDASVASYNIVLSSMKYGVASVELVSTFSTPAGSTYKPSPIDPATITLTEVIGKNSSGGLESRIAVKWTSDQSQPKANIYLRRRDNFSGDPTTFTGFSLDGTAATNNYTTNPIPAVGATVTWDVVVLAVGVTGTEAAFTAAQVKTIAVQQYANYAPLQQELPTVAALNQDQVSLLGGYARPTGTPAPVSVNIYKSETDIGTANLVAKVPLQPTNDPTIFKWQYDVQSLQTQFGSPSLITLRYALENGTETSTANKTVVKVVMPPPGTAPVLAFAQAYVKTVSATVSNCTNTLTTATTDYTPVTGGNGTAVTITLPLNQLVFEVSDGGDTPGLNPENITPSLDVSGDSATAIFTPSKNSGTRNIRARFSTAYGLSAYSNAIQVSFTAVNTIDSTMPDMIPCVPRFVSNADGSITITWSPAIFGTSGLGCYTIRRSATNDSTTSVVVGEVSSSYTNGGVFTWTDFIPTDRQGYTYYYWLEATSGQGVKASMIPVKLQSANSYSAETVTAAVSTDALPATVASITAVGAQGGFNITWAGVPDRDLKEYQLEFSALGTWADTVTVAVKSNSYYQTLGATASAATAAAYRWRVKAKDFNNQLSAAYATSAAPDLTNYGSIQDSAPAAAAAVTMTVSNDGSITLNLTASTAPYFHIKRLSSAATWTPVTSGTGDDAKIEAEDIIAGNTTKYTVTGLNPKKFYTFQVFTRSKLGTDATTFPVPPTPQQALYQVPGVLRPNLLVNGHFGDASGNFGTSYTGWTLGSGVTFTSQGGSISYNSTVYKTPKFSVSGSSAVVVSQNFQVIPGRRYTVMGIIYYGPTTADGNAYIRVANAGTLSNCANGATVPPAPYDAFGEENPGTDKTTVLSAYRFISYSFTAPAGASTMPLNIGFEGRTATDLVNLYPIFVQVFLDE